MVSPEKSCDWNGHGLNISASTAHAAVTGYVVARSHFVGLPSANRVSQSLMSSNAEQLLFLRIGCEDVAGQAGSPSSVPLTLLSE